MDRKYGPGKKSVLSRDQSRIYAVKIFASEKIFAFHYILCKKLLFLYCFHCFCWRFALLYRGKHPQLTCLPHRACGWSMIQNSNLPIVWWSTFNSIQFPGEPIFLQFYCFSWILSTNFREWDGSEEEGLNFVKFQILVGTWVFLRKYW